MPARDKLDQILIARLVLGEQDQMIIRFVLAFGILKTLTVGCEAIVHIIHFTTDDRLDAICFCGLVNSNAPKSTP